MKMTKLDFFSDLFPDLIGDGHVTHKFNK